MMNLYDKFNVTLIFKYISMFHSQNHEQVARQELWLLGAVFSTDFRVCKVGLKLVNFGFDFNFQQVFDAA